LKNTLLLETLTHHLNFQEVIIFLLVEGLASAFTAADRSGWVVAEGWGDGGSFLR